MSTVALPSARSSGGATSPSRRRPTCCATADTSMRQACRPSLAQPRRTSPTWPSKPRVRDPQVSFRLAQLLVRNLLDLIPNARPIGLNGLFKGVAKLTCWAMASDEKDIAHVLVEGIAAAPPDFVDAALSRMESTQNGLFWEVNERVISFDWVEQSLRDQIPRLRTALGRAKAAGNGAVIDLKDAPVVTKDMVKTEPTTSDG